LQKVKLADWRAFPSILVWNYPLVAEFAVWELLLIRQLNIVKKSQIPPVSAHNHKACAGWGPILFSVGDAKIRLPPSRERGFFVIHL